MSSPDGEASNRFARSIWRANSECYPKLRVFAALYQ